MGAHNGKMHAMVLEVQGRPLVYREVPIPQPGAGQVLIKVTACGVCRTDLHIADGDLHQPKLPLIPGHEIIGTVVGIGPDVQYLQDGDSVGVPWVAYTCGTCTYCRRQQENLCENALFTGYTTDGGFAGYTVAWEQYCLPLPAALSAPAMAPLLCAGLIGYRSYAMAGTHVTNLGIYGFGAAAHILVQVAASQGKNVFAFTRDGDTDAQQFALQMGATWAGNASDNAPEVLDGAIIFAPAGELVPKALRDIDKGCTVVCGGIHMTDIPSFPYDILWGERTVRSVANLTRQDGIEFLKIASRLPINTEVQIFPLKDANDALGAMRAGKIHGAAVLIM